MSPKLGLVIGTYGSPAYIHLQLEAARRNCSLPILVHNDGDHEQAALRSVCAKYGARLVSGAERLGHSLGDLQALHVGLHWAQHQRLDLLVKFSRRWIPLIPWQEDLEKLFTATGGATFSNRCVAYGYGFRTECVALDVHAWSRTDAFALARDQLLDRHSQILVESVVHRCAEKAAAVSEGVFRKWQEATPSHPHCGGYVPWPLLSESRNAPRAEVLWYEWAGAHDYRRAALQWGIDYEIRDFAV